AQLGPGVDVTVLDDGFGLAFAASASDAEVVRVAGPWLRVEERVHEHGAWGLRHVAAGEDDDALAVRVDAGDARTIVKAGGAPLRVSALGGWIGVTPADGRLRALWTLPPGGPMMPASFGFSRGSRSTQRARLVPAPESVRAAVRDDGALAVALKRTGAIWTGVTDAKLSASGPLVAIDRRGATLGAPSIATARDGAIVVWSERAEGAAEWSVVVAAVSGGAVTTHVVGAGMSPSIVALADGDLVVAYAVGASGAHRVVAQRLAPSLEPRGEAVPISPGEMNAGQPAVAVAADGRGVVAFFVADAHDRGALHATPLACAVR
ncbi:MAG TPA: hypothetical protein VIF62_05245, partial [Labilithrix sp.]